MTTSSHVPYWPHNAKDPVRFMCHEFFYASDGEDGGLQLATKENVEKMIEKGFMSPYSVLLYEFEAGSWVEAMQEHHRRQGYDPYVPMTSVPKDE